MGTPKPWEIRRAKEVGRKGTARYIFRVCTCGAAAWVQYNNYIAGRVRQCKACANREKSKRQKGPGGSSWKGGRVVISGGYIGVRVYEGDPLFCMAPPGRGYVREHRLVMARHLGRALDSSEVVHHKNGVKNDNRIENLELKNSNQEHMAEHRAGYRHGYEQGYRDGLQKAREELGK